MHNYTSTTQGSGGSFTNRRYRRGWLLWVRDGRAKTLMDCQVVEVSSLSLSFLLFLWRSTYRPIYVSSYLSIYLSYLIWSDLILSYLILSYLILSIYLSICLSFRPSRPNPNHWKTQCFTFRAPVSFFFWLFLYFSLLLFSSLGLFASLLFISAYCRKFDFWTSFDDLVFPIHLAWSSEQTSPNCLQQQWSKTPKLKVLEQDHTFKPTRTTVNLLKKTDKDIDASRLPR